MESEKIQNLVFLGVGFLIVFLVVLNLNNGFTNLSGKAYLSSGGSGTCHLLNERENGACGGTCPNGKMCSSYGIPGGDYSCQCVDSFNDPCHLGFSAACNGHCFSPGSYCAHDPHDDRVCICMRASGS